MKEFKDFLITNETMGDIIDGLAIDAFGRSLSESLDENKCVMCGKRHMGRPNFSDQESWEDYGINGMCQECQNEVYTSEEMGNEEAN